MNKLKKIILTITLCLVVAISSPLAVFATEAAPAPEASSAPEASTAPEASATPEVSTTDASPSPSPTITTDGSNQQSNNWDDDEDEGDDDEDDVDEDDLNLDGDEWVSSGQNSSGNVGDTSITSGNATAGGTVINSANQSVLSSPLCTVCADDVSVKNSGNGTNSNNSAGVDIDSDSTVTINNDANINNDLDIEADSGHNRASYNVGDSEIETGDANVSGVVITSANETGLGVVEYNILDDHNGDIILVVPDDLFGCGLCGGVNDVSTQNSGNGADSTNTVEVDVDNQGDTTINNDANVVNNLYLDANSGENQTSYNTGGDSSITTGDANVAANLLNFVNSTIAGGAAFIVNVFGNLVGDIIFPDSLPGIGGTSLSAANKGNGADSTNTIDIDSDNQNNTTITNYADIDNILNIDATTGDNKTSYNTGGDNSIETGDVFVNAQVLNVINTNLLGASNEPLWLILVNNMGTWTGSIIGVLTGTNYSGSDGFVFTVGNDGEIMATNNGNGAGSTNDISLTENNTNNLTINNTANVTNNINIDASTGNNEANYNTGGDSKIKTGDVNVAASIMNFVNTNLIGRTLMLGIINVFGSWIGDAVPPGEDPQINTEIVPLQLTGTAGSAGSTGGGPTTSNNLQTIGLGAALSGYPYPHILKPTGLGSFGGFGGFGGFGDDDGSSTTTGGNAPTVLSDSAQNGDGVFSLTFNWKILLASLIPLLAFGIFRARMLDLDSRKEAAVASEVKIRKKK
ncbi:hypothetical protein HY469_04115 [Candidatus Roizmanbacteria bacterium]|nr:hypothetical protein [Candidatus Roizmanbacteria bacterium]